ncbi:prevent-host-death protein [Alkanindiges hydrocarboniclasticus]|uniref:Antitoxin n=1 Tax=Alkanindiges hydrocarboniclasticus TaxID=1907941 RepID=A0A1S8CR08_9GAMM|nr:type II toxin-antitoxin system prevent-host-death family antitoxin [Alkanindiges hydrocarboniclasticus]ONG37403.1 prevent-host-death protein [Alkanindiges hydrocarboniclasticus]
MEVINYSDLRKNLAATLDRVEENHVPVLITRQNGTPAVLISLDDFTAFQETAYLFKSPKNAERLRESINQIGAGKTQYKELVEDDVGVDG